MTVLDHGVLIVGLEALYYLTRDNRDASFYFEDHDGKHRTANYTSFYIENSGHNYILRVSCIQLNIAGISTTGIQPLLFEV